MADNQNIELSESTMSLIQKHLASGKYSNISEIINDGLNLLASEQDKEEALRLAIQKGIDSGIAEDFSFVTHRKDMATKYGQE